MKRENLISIGILCFFLSGILMSIITFTGINLTFKQFLAPIAITLFGLSVILFLFYLVGNLKEEDYAYFKNVIIGIVGGLAVWVFTTINLHLIQDSLLLGLNEILSKLVLSLGIIIVGYLIYKKKEAKK